MLQEKWEDVLCHVAMGNFYYTQIGEIVGEANVDGVLNAMEKAGLITFLENRVVITATGLQRIQGKLSIN